MADIFISYASEDRSKLGPLAKALEDHGWSVWWDLKIPPGKTFFGVIKEALEAAKCVIALWSKQSINSEWVLEEANNGKLRGILVPAKIDSVDPPLGFGLIQAADLTNWESESIHTGFVSLLNAISEIAGPPLRQEKSEQIAEIPESKLEQKSEAQPEEEEISQPPPCQPEPAMECGKQISEIIFDLANKGFLPNDVFDKARQVIWLEPDQLSEEDRKYDRLLDQLLKKRLEPVEFIRKWDKVKPEKKVAEPTSPQKAITNSISMKFVLIPAGKFVMGSPNNEPERDTNERQHEVNISKPFYLQTTEVSQGQWKRVMGRNPSNFKHCGDDCPVENVSWNMAQEFISKLNQMEDTKKYRIPTEAEWEYACRAGTKTSYSFGDEVYKLNEYAWYSENSESQTHPVAQKKPNAWGLYDMHGNVWEWCWDRFEDYLPGPCTDPMGPAEGKDGSSWKRLKGVLNKLYEIEIHVLRGGSWLNVRGTYVRPIAAGTILTTASSTATVFELPGIFDYT